MVLHRLDDFSFAVAVFGHAITDVREKVVAAISAETGTFPVSFENFKDRVVEGTLGRCHNSVNLGALVEASGTKGVSDHLFADFSGEDTTVDVAGALICAKHFFALVKDSIELIDHATLKFATFSKLVHK